jgi:hypothetical protein
MNNSASKGNNTELWEKLLAVLDDKLQLGLLGKLQSVTSYHFENNILYIEPGSVEDYAYLSKPATFQQLELFAQDVTKVSVVKLKN